MNDETFRKRVSGRLNRDWQIHGGPSLTFDRKISAY
ncbi:MAG: DUF1737 domain-containing protein [Desulfobulbus sp.]|nr:DUF1737 domain-containing protein [Desulfobulbus sp.]